MTDSFKNIISYLKRFLNHLIYREFIEILFCDIFIFFLITVSSKYYFIPAMLSFVIFIGIKIKNQSFIDTFLIYNLLKHSEYRYFQILGVINIVIFFMIFTVYSLFIYYIPMYVFLCFLVLRLVFSAQINYMQKVFVYEIIEAILYSKPIDIPLNLQTNYTKKIFDMLDLFEEKEKDILEQKINAEKLKTDLITNISHDLKTPLTSIINYTDLLYKKDKFDEQTVEYLEVLNRNSIRLKSLITDLIFAAKTGSKDIKVEKVILEFNELVLQIYGDFDTLFKNKNLELVYNASDEEINIYTDSNLLARIIENLFSNTVKYAKEDTRIYLDVNKSEENIIFSLKNVSEEALNISSEELLKELIKSDKSRNTEGSGLGLYIVKNIVEVLEGDVTIDIDGDYFKIIITLPLDM